MQDVAIIVYSPKYYEDTGEEHTRTRSATVAFLFEVVNAYAGTPFAVTKNQALSISASIYQDIRTAGAAKLEPGVNTTAADFTCGIGNKNGCKWHHFDLSKKATAFKEGIEKRIG
ncbi:hypothetical protein LTR95_013435 [Oleoguttula sp. CCFEE 5521]